MLLSCKEVVKDVIYLVTKALLCEDLLENLLLGLSAGRSYLECWVRSTDSRNHIHRHVLL